MGKPKRQVSRFHRPALRAKSGFFDEEKFWKNEKTKTAEIQLTTSTHQQCLITHHSSLITNSDSHSLITHCLTHTQHTHYIYALTGYSTQIRPAV
jgi:hypothetical protein